MEPQPRNPDGTLIPTPDVAVLVDALDALLDGGSDHTQILDYLHRHGWELVPKRTAYSDSPVAVSQVSEVAHLYTQDDWARVLDAYVSFVRQVEWITEEVRLRVAPITDTEEEA